MRTAACPRICRATIPSSNHKILHPKHQRLISTSSQNAQDPAISPAVAQPRPTFTGRPSKKGEVRTSGSLGSPDYIPRKRGYAPHMPIPARKFNLPNIKHPKGMSDPQTQAPEAKKARDIKTIGIEYERQLSAMRRGYVQWRYQTRKAKLDKKHENAARPHPPPPPPFKPTFAEEMAEPSSTNQLAVEQRLFANIHTPQYRRVRGAGYQSAHHQAFLARQRRTLINDYLALYHTSYNLITTPESLESEILRNFPDTYVGMYASRPQSYASILYDAEQGTTGSLFDGYISLMNREKENEVYNAMIGTVGEGKPGYDEVVREIEAAFGNEQSEAGTAVSAEKTGIEKTGPGAFSAEHVAEEGTTMIEEKHIAQKDLSRRDEPIRQSSESINDVGFSFDWDTVVEIEQPPSVIAPEVSADESPGLEKAIDPGQVRQPTEPLSQKARSKEDIRLTRIQRYLRYAMHKSDRLVPRTDGNDPDWEPLRENYRNGFSNVIAPRPLPPFITSYTSPDEMSDSDDILHFPSDIEAAMAKSAPSKEPPSIVDQALSYQESIDPQAHSRREIINAAIKQSEEVVKTSKFPELSALVTDDEKSLEYTIKQAEFEKEFPARTARQATDVAAWEAAYQKPGFTGDTLKEMPHEATLNTEGESGVVDDLGPPPEREILRSEFATNLDESQIKELGEIRARREKQGRK